MVKSYICHHKATITKKSCNVMGPVILLHRALLQHLFWCCRSATAQCMPLFTDADRGLGIQRLSTLDLKYSLMHVLTSFFTTNLTAIIVTHHSQDIYRFHSWSFTLVYCITSSPPPPNNFPKQNDCQKVAVNFT